MPKLNKAQTLELVATTVANVIAQSTDLFKKDKAPSLEAVLMARLTDILAPKQAQSTKTNEAGEVYCNYFQHYFEAKHFNTKLGKPDKVTGVRTEGYKANSIAAEVILRKVKSLKAMVSRQVTVNFMDKTITADEMQDILTRLDTMTAERFTDPREVPTVAEIVGLTAPTAVADIDKEAQDDVDDMETWTEQQLAELDDK